MAMKRGGYLVLAGVCFFGTLVMESGAASHPTVSFIKPVTLPALGIRINLMAELRESPPPSPKVYTYRGTAGDLDWKEDRFDPVELWRHAQYAGRWTGRNETRVTLAVMGRTFPDGFREPHATRETYDKVCAAAETHPVVTEEDVERWMPFFTGCPNVTGERLKSMPTRLEPVFRYRLDPGVPHGLAYAFRLNRPGTSTNAPQWVCLLFEGSLEMDPELACRALERECLPSVSWVALAAPAPAAVSRSLTGKAAATGPAPAGADAHDLAQSQVIESIRNLKDWWYEPSKHYIVLSNLKGSVKTLVTQLNQSMDLIRPLYVRCIPDTPDMGVSVIRMPATQGEYTAIVGSENGWSGGMWIPDRRELVIRPLTEAGNMEARRNVFRVAFHEGFHQYAFFALNHTDPAMWFNEGYAQLFENATLQNGKVRIEENARVVALVRRVLESGSFHLVPFLKLARMDFYDADDAVRAANYAMAWGFVYYLKKGVACEAGSPFAGLLDKYVVAIRISGQNGEEATATMLDHVDVHRLETDFERFWHSNTRQANAHRYDPFAADSGH